ncbi:MAG: hypothetical protein QM741_02970 [Rudaea sp.]|uniref:hypothetical protein n=1 Tax=Rudaea sp. TaxID=2136325 RepID=UPI0039E64BE2
MSIKQRLLVALIGASLMVPAVLSAAASAGTFKHVTQSARMSNLQEMAAAGDLVESWSDYALSSLKSNFSWAREPGEVAVEPPTIFTRTRSSWARTPTSGFPGTSVDGAKPFQVAMQSARISESPILTAATDAGSLLPGQAPGLRRTIVAPSFTHSLENMDYWRFSLILAYQKFSLFAPLQGSDGAFGRDGWAWQDSSPSALRHKENSAGLGARIDTGGRLVPDVEWRVGYQSRVIMDNFYTYRGIYGQAGSFDIPASANFGMDWTPARNFRLSADFERVIYSQVAPFAGYSLPSLLQRYIYLSNRALAWENLDIYSVAAAWRNASLGEFGLRYSTREQPMPNLAVLQHFLEPNLASHDWEFDYARAFGDRSKLRFRAVYAPLQLLGLPSYTADGNYGANRMRYEALLTTSF